MPARTRASSNPCTDGILSTGETDVDCGGTTCGKCANGKTCAAVSDCASGFCNLTTTKCVADACSDGALSTGETDIDCGGATCAKCVVGKTCNGSGDCASGVCDVNKKCVSTACSDGILDNGESDIDGGGAVCAKCANGKTCTGPTDCTSSSAA